ncbi:MAG: HD-GYP domain-containing protein [Deltaproteobacteria bacterium]|nr:HD-GYP domain-containing protein [Deltaproteobacteria bacterium]
MNKARHELDQLLDIINQVAGGNYSNDIMALTTETTSGPIRSIAEAVGMMMVKVETREYQLEQLIEELKRLNDQIRLNAVQTVSAMAQALEARDLYTRGHAERVASIAAEIAVELGLDEQRVELVRTAGILHDIGKIGCSDRIFQDHGAKNPPDVVKEILGHPAVGADILGRLEFLDTVTRIIVAHHERVDGKGYPNKLSIEQIPLESRIIAVADGFDAMTTDRPYQKARSWDVALGILQEGAGSHWDTDCVAAFERLQMKKDMSVASRCTALQSP